MQMFGSDGKLQYWKELDPQLHVSGPCLSKVSRANPNPDPDPNLTAKPNPNPNPNPNPDPNPNPNPSPNLNPHAHPNQGGRARPLLPHLLREQAAGRGQGAGAAQHDAALH